MRKIHALILVLAICVSGIAATAVATAAKPTVVRAGNLVLKLNGGVSPNRLPRQRMAPIALSVSGQISTTDGSHPPAARTMVIDFDRNGGIDARGLPTCRRGQLEARTTSAARAACRRAIVGTGRTRVQVQFAESLPFSSSGPLIAFNGGVRGGKTRLYIHAYVDVPAPTAVVTSVVVKKVRKGRFGTRATVSIPEIAGGSGSVTSFSLRLKRDFRRGGQRRSYLTARCRDGRFVARADVRFAAGPRIGGQIVRPCRPRGR